jgi:hypothetical protein
MIMLTLHTHLHSISLLTPFNSFVFKGSGPNSRSSQIFIAYGPNEGLGRQVWETPVGRVVSGMEHAVKFYSYGEMPPRGNGPLQSKIYEGHDYIDTEFPLTDSFETCTVQRSQQGIDKAADKMGYFRRDNANWSVAALLLAFIVLGYMMRKAIRQRRRAPP